jgi:hypothetical protein
VTGAIATIVGTGARCTPALRLLRPRDGSRIIATVTGSTIDIRRLEGCARDLVAVPSENPPGRAYDECVERISAELEACGSVYERGAADMRGGLAAMVHGAEAPLVAALAGAVEDVTGARPSLTCCPGMLGTRFYSALGIPAVAFGPGAIEAVHAPDERVPLSNLAAAAEVYARVAVAVA